ncbi:MAG: hypothetical protein ACK5K7_06705 [Bacilli bacterium]
MSLKIKSIKKNEYIEAISLQYFIDELEEKVLKDILSSFSCKRNSDVENFIRSKAVSFEKNSWSKTFLFIHVNKNLGNKIIGYVAISEKYIDVSSMKLSKTKKKNVKRKAYCIDDMSAIKTLLLGQVARNDEYNSKLFNMDIVMDFMLKISGDHGGLFPYHFMSLECDKNMMEFYERYGFKDTEISNMEKDLNLMIRNL